MPYANPAHVELACRAALRMVEHMAAGEHGWRCGIGLGVGRVVAGTAGSKQVYTGSVLGPVVNQTSRVEGITKIVGEPILVTRDVAQRLSPDAYFTRRVARFLPAGVETEVDLYTIHLRPDDPAARERLAERLARHERALERFESGHWSEAEALLHDLAPQDAAAKYLYKLALPRGRLPATGTASWN